MKLCVRLYPETRAALQEIGVPTTYASLFRLGGGLPRGKATPERLMLSLGPMEVVALEEELLHGGTQTDAANRLILRGIEIERAHRGDTLPG